MSLPDPNLSRLFQDMAKQPAAPESSESSSQRRQRAIGGMRALHRSLLVDAAHAKRRRRYWSWGLAAAAVALAGTALAGAGGLLTRAGPAAASQPSSARDRSAAESSPSSVPEVLPVARPTSADTLPSVPRELTGTPPSHRATPAVELAEVNALFAEAKRARREHRDAQALALLQRLLAKYPHSVLAHEATVEQFRALSRLGRNSEARRHAGTYLVQYPHGFAADEARRLIASGQP